MTVAVQTPFASFLASGSATFAYAFKVNAAADLIVKINGVTQLSSLYSVTGVGTSAGSVVFISAPTAGAIVTVRRKALLQRITDYQNNGDFLAGTVNPDVDGLWMALQDQQYQQTMALQLSSSDIVGVSTTLPTPVGGAVIGWNASATALVNFVLQAGTSLVNLAASAGSSLIGFIQAGIGAILRTVQDKLRETISITDYAGVDATGATDSTAGIQAAITALLPYQKLLVPYGTFNFTNLTFTGKTYFGLEIIGKLVCTAAKPGGTGIDKRGTDAGLQTIKFDTCSHFRVYGSGSIQNGYREPLFFTTCTDFDVAVDCLGNGTNDNLSGIYVRYCQRFHFGRMTVDGVTLKNTNNVTEVYTQWSNNVQIWDSSGFVIDSGFTSRNAGMNGIYPGSNCSDFTITNTICEYNAGSGIQPAWSSFGSFPVRFNISNNVLRYNQGDGLDVNNTSGANVDIFAAIVGNTHQYNGWINCNPANAAGSDGSGIGTFMNVNRWTAVGNTVSECANFGAYVFNCNNWGITGGDIIKSNAGTLSGGVFISGGTSGEVFKVDVKVPATLPALSTQSMNNVTIRGGSYDGLISCANGTYPGCSMRDARIVGYNQVVAQFDIVNCQVSVTNASQNGIYVNNPSLVIDRNTVAATGIGIVNASVSYTQITNNTASGGSGQQGIYVDSSSNVKISGNSGSSGSSVGIQLLGTSSNCEFSNNKGTSTSGNSFRIESTCTGTNKWGNISITGTTSFLGTYGINF